MMAIATTLSHKSMDQLLNYTLNNRIKHTQQLTVVAPK